MSHAGQHSLVATAYHTLELYQLYIVAHQALEAHRLVLNFQVGSVRRTPERQCSLLLQGKQQEA